MIAIEPHPDSFRYLLRNLSVNGINNVIPIRAACWNRVEPVTLTGDAPERHRIINLQAPDLESVKANGVTVDGLVEGLGLVRVDWIKCDVEGAECEVLEGARLVLRRFRPTLLVEVHGAWERLTALLGEVGYCVEESKLDRPLGRRGFIRARPSHNLNGEARMP